MNARTIILGVVVLVLAGGAYFAVGRNNAEPLPYIDPRLPTPTYVPPEEADRYIPYTPEAFNAAAGMKRVLFFFAPWCSTCVPLDKKIQANTGEIPEDVVLFRVDYDTEKDLKAQYGITYQHTFVFVDGEGNALTTWNGGGLDEIITNTQ
jgi:thiol-disulfide isomerase/thioredoxin